MVADSGQRSTCNWLAVRKIHRDATDKRVTEFNEDARPGYRIILSGFPGSDVQVELILAAGETSQDDESELLVQIA